MNPMESYEARLSTFNNNWPASHPVKKEDLARAGQYYSDGNTKCYRCNRRTTNWVEGDDPYEEHKRLYPDCPLSRRSPIVIAAEPSSLSQEPGTSSDGCAHASVDSYTTLPSTQEKIGKVKQLGPDLSPKHKTPFETCLSTYGQNFPLEIDFAVQNLSLGGFSYTGTGDCVQCLKCKLKMNNWEPGEVPYYEHLAEHSECEYIKSIQKELKTFNERMPVRQIPVVDQPTVYNSRKFGRSDSSKSKKIKVPLKSATPVCLKCNIKPRQVLFEPCCHVVLCVTCSEEYSHCPACGCPIIKKSRFGPIDQNGTAVPLISVA